MINLLNATSSSLWTMLPLLLGMFILMTVMTIVPQRKRQKKMSEMLNQLNIGTHIKTIGGLIGVITEVKEDNTLVVNIGLKDIPTYIILDRNAIYQNLDAQPVVNTKNVKKDNVKVVEDKVKDDEKKIDE
jgi:preprotein translocase subunit YajC